jgi:hypothetical protein
MIDARQRLALPFGASPTYHSLPLLEKRRVRKISRLSVRRILLESVLRNLDGWGESVTLALRIETAIESDSNVAWQAAWRSFFEAPAAGPTGLETDS